VRAQNEIQRAHDLLHFLVAPDFPNILDADDTVIVRAGHDAMAWVLGFPCGDAFAENLAAILAMLKRLGFEEVDVGTPISHEEAKRRGLE